MTAVRLADGQLLGPVLQAHLGWPVTELVVTPSLDASTHPIYRLELGFHDGRRESLIVKCSQPLPDRSADREESVYRSLLAERAFGAPLLYASCAAGESGGTWLFLEDVGRHRLDRCGRRGWTAAFRALARLHAAFDGRERELADVGCLTDHDADFYRAQTTAAMASVSVHGTTAAATRLQRMCGWWLASTVAELTAQPRTLVHGNMYAPSVHVQPGLRVRILDWETAAIGVPAWDLSRLLAGWGSAKPGLVAEYAAEFARQVGAPPDRGALGRTLALCDILRSLRTLHWWKAPCADPAYVDGLLDHMERSWRGLGGGHD